MWVSMLEAGFMTNMILVGQKTPFYLLLFFPSLQFYIVVWIIAIDH